MSSVEQVEPVDLGDLADRSVAEVMVSVPKVHGAGLSVGEARAVLADDHVHMVLLVGAEDRLVGTLVRDDLAGVGADEPALDAARLDGRLAPADGAVAEVLPQLRGAVARRLAVVDEEGRLVGLLCLKRSRRGFCDDAGVLARAAERG